jgi:hypothetical protein
VPPALRIVLLALTALAVAAPGAQAALAPSVTAQMTDEGTAKGWRTLRVDVSGTCGPAAAPGTTSYVSADLRRAATGTGGKTGPPFSQGLDYIGSTESVEGTTATYRFRISGGWSAVAVAEISCSEPEGEYGCCEARSEPTAAVLAPLRLDTWEALGTSVNGGPRCSPPRRRVLRAHAGYDLAFDLGPLDARTLFGHAGTSPRLRDLGKVKFHLRGGGTRTWDRVVSKRGFTLFHRLVMGYYFQPRKPRTVTMWLTVGGLETNRLTVRVLPRKKGCRRL